MYSYSTTVYLNEIWMTIGKLKLNNEKTKFLLTSGNLSAANKVRDDHITIGNV